MPKNVKNTTFFNPLDLFAPHSCKRCGRLGSILCDRCKNYILENTSNICPHCKTQNLGKCPKCHLPPTYTIGYRDGLLDDLIHTYKYDSVRALGDTLAYLLSARLPDIDGTVAIVPLPTSTAHIRKRGFDHTLHLAKKLARLRSYRVTPLLIRNKNTVQVGASRSVRLTQADSAYTINHKLTPDPSTTYILLDDVWTTGASMTAAIKKLRSAGVKKIILAILAVSTLED